MQFNHNKRSSDRVNISSISENVEVQSTYDINDFLSLDPRNLISDSNNLQTNSNIQVSISPPIQILRLNINRFNKNMISITGSLLLFLFVLIAFCPYF